MPATSIDLEFADGSYTFALKLPQLAELQEKCGTGIFAIYGRLLKGRYLLGEEVVGMAHEGQAFAEDCYETIRLGLIGGGEGLVNGEVVKVTPLLAKQLVERYIHPAPLREAWSTAAAIMAAKIEGYDPGPKGEPAASPAKTSSGSRRGSTRKRRSSTAA